MSQFHYLLILDGGDLLENNILDSLEKIIVNSKN